MTPAEDMIRASEDAYALATEWVGFATASDTEAEQAAHAAAFFVHADEVVADPNPNHGKLVLSCLCSIVNALLLARAEQTGKSRQQVLEELAATSAGWSEDNRDN